MEKVVIKIKIYLKSKDFMFILNSINWVLILKVIKSQHETYTQKVKPIKYAY